MVVKRVHLAVLIMTCLLSGGIGGWMARTPVASAQGFGAADGADLPADLFGPGHKVMRQKSVYLIEEVRGGWIRARLHQSLDDNAAPSTAPRWIYVPAESSPWTRAD